MLNATATTRAVGRGQPRRRLPLRAALAALVLAVACPQLAGAQEAYVNREAKIKAAYLYKLINYVEWPEEAFTDAAAPLVMGTVGSDPVNSYLQLIAENRSAGNRQLVYRPIDDPAEAARCHLLFVSDSVEEETFAAIVPHVTDQPVLLVGESPGFARIAGVLGFVIVDNNVRLQLSMKAAEQRKLKISSQLAKIAQVVD